jgi:hypothetical protein
VSTTNSTKTRTSRFKKATIHYELIYSILDFLHRSGISKTDLGRITSSALSKVRTVRSNRATDSLLTSTVASSIGVAFHRWYRERSLITAAGEPKPLKLLGPMPSVEGLLRREKTLQTASAIVPELVRLKLVRRLGGGLYVPTGMHALIRNAHPYIFEHLAHSVVRLLSTVQRNAKTASPHSVLFERYAHVPNMSARNLSAFRDFTNQQGEALIDTTNDWLESHRSKSNVARRIRPLQAGLHVFAYVGEKTKIRKRHSS